MDAHVSFKTSAFIDPPEVLAETVNGLAGHALADWLSRELKARGLDASAPWSEDHGWDFSVTHGGAKYVCACSLATEDGAPFEGHVAIGKVRSVMDKLRGRNAFDKADPVAAAIHAALAGNADVSSLAVEA